MDEAEGLGGSFKVEFSPRYHAVRGNAVRLS